MIGIPNIGEMPTADLDSNELTALRRGAAMAHTVAGITLRLRSAGEVLATVRSAAARGAAAHPSGSHGDGRLIDPCGFRVAVSRVWADHQAGRRVAVIGQHAELDVDWSIEPPGRLLGFGGVRSQCAGTAVWAFASVLPTEELVDTFAAVDVPADVTAARVVRDELLDISVVYVELTTPSATLMATIDDITRDLVARNTVAELVGQLVGDTVR